MITSEVYKELLLHNAPIVIPTFQGRKGHPILFNSEVIEDVLHCAAYRTLREVINNKQTVLTAVSCSGILMDLDTRSDYHKLQNSLNEGVSL
jgi:molybdenum cofactor cytidylyltransferase